MYYLNMGNDKKQRYCRWRLLAHIEAKVIKHRGKRQIGKTAGRRKLSGTLGTRRGNNQRITLNKYRV